MKTIETYIVDSFTDEPFKGNPAGVCILENILEIELMFSIAKELGLSETAFIRKLEDSESYSIRYFSPKMEIPLCGHATLASAKVIFEKIKILNEISFVTAENLEISVKRSEDKIVMEFPIYQTRAQEVPEELLIALGLEKVKNSVYNRETKILLLEIEDCHVLQNLRPDYAKLIDSHHSINGVLVTAASTKVQYDFESRYFWPWSGTNEDPVTGGTHTFLANYWAQILKKKKLNSFQCSERTGFMEVELISDDKMTIKSSAKIVLKGELRIPNS